MLSIVVFSSIAILADSSVYESEVVRKLEQSILESRERIKSGTVLVRSDWKRTGSDGVVTANRRRWRVFFDGDKLRQDELSLDQPSTHPGAKHRIARDTHVTRLYRVAPPDELGYVGAGVYPSDQQTELMFPVSEPRLLGITPSTFLDLSPRMSSTLIGGRIEMIGITVEDGQIDNKPCRILVYRQKSGEARIWVQPHRDFNVVRIITHYGPQQTQVDCVLTEVLEIGWFPSQVVFNQKSENSYVTTETLDIEFLEANQPVDPNIFNFVGMGVPVGTVVHDFTANIPVQLEMSVSGPVSIQPKIEDRPKQNYTANGRGHFNSFERLLFFNGIAIAAAVVWWLRARHHG